jgi:hypothetical protein
VLHWIVLFNWLYRVKLIVSLLTNGHWR